MSLFKDNQPLQPDVVRHNLSEIEKWRAEFDASFTKFGAEMRAPANDDIQANDCVFLWELGIRVD